MRKLLLIILLLPYFASAQVNGTIQKIPASGLIRGSFGTSGIDTLVRVQGLPGFTTGQILIWNNTLKKFVAGNANPDTTVYRTVANSFSKSESNTSFVNTTGDTMTGLLTINNGIGNSASFSGDLVLGTGYLTGGGTIQLDNTFGNNLIGNLMPKIPTNSGNHVGLTLFGDAVGNALDLNTGTGYAVSLTSMGAYSIREATRGGFGSFYGQNSGGGWTNLGLANTGIGINSLYKFTGGGTSTLGDNNTALGAGAGQDASGSANVYIGVGAGQNNTLNNKLFINNSSGTPLIGGDFSARTVNVDGSVTATSLIKSGGTSSQFLKADGSVDNSTYLTSGGAVTSITGTANQVIASGSTGAVTLSLPQDIGTSSTPTFGGQTLTGSLTGTSATFSGKVVFGSGSFSSNTAAAYTDATRGLLLTGKGGSLYDFFFANSTGSEFLANPTGTQNALLFGSLTGTSATFSGSTTASSFIKSGGTSLQYLMADGSVSTGPSTSGFIQASPSSTQSAFIDISGSVYSGKSILGGAATGTGHLNIGGATTSTPAIYFILGNYTGSSNGSFWFDGSRLKLRASSVENTLAYTSDTQSGVTSSAASLTLDYANRHYVFTGTTSTWTLPVIAGGTWDEFLIKNRGSGTLTINTAAGNVIYNTSASNTISLAPGDAIILVNDGTYFVVE